MVLIHTHTHTQCRGTNLMYMSQSMQSASYSIAVFLFFVLLFLSVFWFLFIPVGLFFQEAEEAADKDKYNYWESNHPQTHGFLSHLHLFCCILTATPGHTSCTAADGKGFTNVVVKCNYRQTRCIWETIPSDCIGMMKLWAIWLFKLWCGALAAF